MRFLTKNLVLSSFLAVCALLFSSRSQAESLTRYEYTQIHMGTQVRMAVYADSKEKAERACTAAYNRIAELEQVCSDYRPTSELMRLCTKAGGNAIPVSEDLFIVLEKAQEVAKQSRGAFDITVGPLVQLWRTARRTQVFPNDADLKTAKKLVGWRNVVLDKKARTVRLKREGMRLDLGGIAKGYACDAAQTVLKANGIHIALVEAGGEIVVSDAPPNTQGWSIEITNPDPQRNREVRVFTNAAISTSGDSEQFVEFNGKRYSHVVDPRTGLGLTTRTTVTIIGTNGMTTDALATAVGVLGKANGTRLVKRYPGFEVIVR